MTTTTRAVRRTGLAALPLALLATACSGSSRAGTGSTSSPAASAPAPSLAASSPGIAAGAQQPVPVEKNPPGDIPDNVAFVAYTDSTAGFTFTHPEGWAQSGGSGSITFTDKLNGVQVTSMARSDVPTVATARQKDVPALQNSQPAFELRSVTAVTEKAGDGVRIVYRRNSAPDPVTGRQYRDEVERYVLVRNGRALVMELYAPVGADNVDAYKTMVSSLRAR